MLVSELIEKLAAEITKRGDTIVMYYDGDYGHVEVEFLEPRFGLQTTLNETTPVTLLRSIHDK